MQDVFLSKGAHPSRFDLNGKPTMCAAEYAAYLAGEPHTDRPKSVSPVPLDFVIRWNDALDGVTRQRLRPYISRMLGTARDGQDEARRYVALEWLVREYAPAFLATAGLTEEAEKLRGLAAIEDLESCRVARLCVEAAWYPAVLAAAYDAYWDAAEDADWYSAAEDATYGAAAYDAARAATNVPAPEAYETARDVAVEVAYHAARATANAAAQYVYDVGAWAAVYDVTRASLRPTVEMLEKSAFELLDRLIDPGGIHDVETEAALLERRGSTTKPKAMRR